MHGRNPLMRHDGDSRLHGRPAVDGDHHRLHLVRFDPPFPPALPVTATGRPGLKGVVLPG